MGFRRRRRRGAGKCAGPWRAAWSAIYRRVRHRRAHERDLAHTIERFQSAAEAIPDGMVVLDATNRIKWANQRAQALLGLELVPRSGRAACESRAAARVRALHRIRRLRGRASSSTCSATRAPRSPSRSFRSALPRSSLIARDVTQIEAVARMRRDFIANVSHELKTPLTVISGFVETLQELELDERQRARFLQLMQEQAAACSASSRTCSRCPRCESEHIPLPDERFAVVPMLLALRADAKELSKGNHEVSLDVGDAATVVGSREELASAFGNLVSNAIRYTPVKGTIKLSWRIEADGSGVFAVTDSGIGIGAERDPARAAAGGRHDPARLERGRRRLLAVRP